MPSKNNVIIASAGSGKTTYLVDEALSRGSDRVLLTTYTIEGTAQIRNYILERVGVIPSNITVMSWFSFLLRDGVRPYQRYLTSRQRIPNVDFVGKRPKYARKADVDKFYLNTLGWIYRNETSDFVVAANQVSGGKVIKRLEEIYDYIMIDEIQDVAGCDLDFIKLLMESSISVTAVGDVRQATYSTNTASKNKQYRGVEIFAWLEQLKRMELFTITERTDCYRCNQDICNIADSLYPHLPKTISMNTTETDHDGVFFITPEDVPSYMERFRPIVLRYSKRTNTLGLDARNVGAVKGMGFDRVLIFPTSPWRKFLSTKDLTKAGDIAKLYVAITRARQSVAFVL